MSVKKVFVATFESRHFSFMAAGFTEAEAREAMVTGLNNHAEECGLDKDWAELDDINIDECPIGECLRDHSPIARAKPEGSELKYRKGRVTADFLPDGKEIECYSKGDAWNGFGCPAFDLKEGKKLCYAGSFLSYSKKDDSFLWDAPGSDPVTFDGFDIDVDGRKIRVYSIGAYFWCWYKVEFDSK